MWTRVGPKNMGGVRIHYGYKNHVNVDRKYKLIRRYHVSDASVHDSQALADILTCDNTAKDVWADSAYRSAQTEKTLQDQKLRSKIHRKAQGRVSELVEI
jgi:IS5 family transposase